MKICKVVLSQKKQLQGEWKLQGVTWTCSVCVWAQNPLRCTHTSTQVYAHVISLVLMSITDNSLSFTYTCN